MIKLIEEKEIGIDIVEIERFRKKKFIENESFYKKIFTNLYSNLLDEKNKIYQNSDIIIPQPVYFKNKSLIQDFDECHKKGLLNEVINFLPAEERDPFESHLKQNVLYLGNMFITKRKYFENYCEIIFPWVEKCFNFCRDKNYLNDY